jgi:hypothetical protein
MRRFLISDSLLSFSFLLTPVRLKGLFTTEATSTQLHKGFSTRDSSHYPVQATKMEISIANDLVNMTFNRI